MKQASKQASKQARIPFISIILVCYNYAHLLPKALAAIERQTFLDFEVVLVNNGSTDQSSSIMRKFQAEHPDIQTQIITIEQNNGVAQGDNTGSRAATGEYLMFHDADDWMDDQCLELLATAAKESGADRVIGAYREVNENGKVLRNRTFGRKPNPWICNMQQANLFRRSVYQGNHIEVSCHFVDHEKTMLFCGCTGKTVYVRTPCYNYLIHQNSATKGRKVYERIWEKPYSLELMLRRFHTVYDSLEKEKDKDWSEYETIRAYYIYIYQYLLTAPLKIKWSEYEKLHKIMESIYPGYLKNPKISLFRMEGDGIHSRLSVWGSAMAERLHLMKLLLLCLHLMSLRPSAYV